MFIHLMIIMKEFSFPQFIQIISLSHPTSYPKGMVASLSWGGVGVGGKAAEA
jgi:hypothetical protein